MYKNQTVFVQINRKEPLLGSKNRKSNEKIEDRKIERSSNRKKNGYYLKICGRHRLG